MNPATGQSVHAGESKDRMAAESTVGNSTFAKTMETIATTDSGLAASTTTGQAVGTLNDLTAEQSRQRWARQEAGSYRADSWGGGRSWGGGGMVGVFRGGRFWRETVTFGCGRAATAFSRGNADKLG